ncbi:hypothetical protein [Streptomyces sp. KHY 26]
MPTDRTQQLLLALIATTLVVYIGCSHPSTIPALTLALGAFVAVAAILKL